MKVVASLLQVPEDLLRSTITSRQFFSGKAGEPPTNIPLTKEQAVVNRDAMSKVIYKRSRNEIVFKITKIRLSILECLII